MNCDPVTTARTLQREEKRWLSWLLVCFAMVQGLFLALDARYPYVFLRGDRSTHRMAAIEALGRLSDWHALIAYLGTHGNIGDYAPQAAVYLAGGKLALVLAQICLMLLSGICVFRLARMCELSARASCLATALYLASPHSLVLPHQLCSEGLFVPLVVGSTWLTCEAIRRRSQLALSVSGLLAALAALTRPVNLLWPPVVAFGLRRHGAPARAHLVFLAAAYAPLLAWMVFVWHQTGTAGMGDSDHSVGLNLYGRVEAIAATMPPNEAATVRARYLGGERREVTPANYLSFAAHYPLPFITYAARDAEVFLFKSGVERITIDYLANDQQTQTLQTRNGSGWRQYWDTHGAVAAMRYGWQVLGFTFVISLLAAAIQVVFVVLVVLGAVHVLGLLRRHPAESVSSLAEFLVLSLPLYFLIFSQLADANQSRHRAPAEFALAILATHGLLQARLAWRARSARYVQSAAC